MCSLGGAPVQPFDSTLMHPTSQGCHVEQNRGCRRTACPCQPWPLQPCTATNDGSVHCIPSPPSCAVQRSTRGVQNSQRPGSPRSQGPPDCSSAISSVLIGEDKTAQSSCTKQQARCRSLCVAQGAGEPSEGGFPQLSLPCLPNKSCRTLSALNPSTRAGWSWAGGRSGPALCGCTPSAGGRLGSAGI